MKNVLITGASHGIGAECARLFVKNGYTVYINYNQSEAEALALENELGCVAIKADVSNASEVEAMANSINEYGGIDVLINNAGISEQKMLQDITEADWDKMFAINAKGPFLVTKACLPCMLRKKQGKIINISSVWGVEGGSCEVHYSASKAAVIGFTKALSKELGPSGICVNCIAPGIIDTKMNNHLSVDEKQAFCEGTALGRMGTPLDIAKTALFLASDGADYITGQIIGVNGGI